MAKTRTRTPNERRHDEAICLAMTLIARAIEMLGHTERLSYIATRARRHHALDFLGQAATALNSVRDLRPHKPE